MSMHARAVVIGAGLGGLAAAIRLLEQGYAVTVLERREGLGGRAYQLQDGGYTFDMGPSLITMPWLLDELYALAGTSSSDQLRLRRLDPFYRIHWMDDPRTFDFSGSHERMKAEIARFSAEDAGRYDAFMARSRAIYEQGSWWPAGSRSWAPLSSRSWCPRCCGWTRSGPCRGSSDATSTSRTSARRSTSIPCSSAAIRPGCRPSTPR